ncbi:MAG: fibronectin type III domain-containing protein [Myxococcales bacterium]
MRTVAITAISLALLTLYACSDSNSDTIPTDGNGGAGGSSSSQAGSSARAGSAGSSIVGAAGDGTESAGSPAAAGAAGAAGATDADAGNGDTAGAAGASTSTGGTSTGGGAGRTGSAGAAGSPDDNGGSQIPAPPSGAAIDTTTSNFVVSVSWTDNSSDETGFNVYISTDDDKPASPTVTLPANSVEYDLKQVQAARTYRVWVEALNDAGVSSAAQVTASAPTADFAWDDLYYDEATGNVYLAAQDMFGFLSDESYVTNLYGYHSPSASLASVGPAQLLDPTYTYPAASSGIDITIPQYFWVEARSTNGSLFSQRTLAPAGTVTNLQASTGASSVTLTWDATPSAASYEVFYGTGSVAGATRLADTTTTTALVPSLVPNTQYFFWVRAKATAIGGSGFPGLYGVTQATIAQ